MAAHAGMLYLPTRCRSITASQGGKQGRFLWHGGRGIGPPQLYCDSCSWPEPDPGSWAQDHPDLFGPLEPGTYMSLCHAFAVLRQSGIAQRIVQDAEEKGKVRCTA